MGGFVSEAQSSFRGCFGDDWYVISALESITRANDM